MESNRTDAGLRLTCRSAISSPSREVIAQKPTIAHHFKNKKMQKVKLENLVMEKSNPCVTISMNTNRTHPDSEQDIIVLKNLLTKVKDQLMNEFGKRPAFDLLKNIDRAEKEIDFNYNLDSLHIFLSHSTNEIIKLPGPTPQNTFYIGERFAIKPLIKAVNRTEEYLILLLSQSGVKLFRTVNDAILQEIKNGDFPFAGNPHYLNDTEKISDGKQVDNMVREFFNKIDKALVKVYNQTNMNCVVVCTEDNYSRLMQVADKQSIYYGFARVNYNDTKNNILAAQAWAIVYAGQKKRRADAIREMKEAAGQNRVITELSEIYSAVKEGRGDLLIIHDDFHQAIKMAEEFSSNSVNDDRLPGATDDVMSDIAWEVISKKGRTIFTDGEELKVLGDIALKVRY